MKWVSLSNYNTRCVIYEQRICIAGICQQHIALDNWALNKKLRSTALDTQL